MIGPRLIELVRNHGFPFSIVLAGHPKFKNDLHSVRMEEIGARAVVIMLEGLQGEQRPYIQWLLGTCKKPKTQLDDLLTLEAIDLLVERPITHHKCKEDTLNLDRSR